MVVLTASVAPMSLGDEKYNSIFCFSKGEKNLFKKRFQFKKNHLKSISLKWKGFLRQMKRISTLKWKGFTFLKSRWNEMKRKLFLPIRILAVWQSCLTGGFYGLQCRILNKIYSEPLIHALSISKSFVESFLDLI